MCTPVPDINVFVASTPSSAKRVFKVQLLSIRIFGEPWHFCLICVALVIFSVFNQNDFPRCGNGNIPSKHAKTSTVQTAGAQGLFPWSCGATQKYQGPPLSTGQPACHAASCNFISTSRPDCRRRLTSPVLSSADVSREASSRVHRPVHARRTRAL